MSWWRYIARDVGIASSGIGSWKRRVATALVAPLTAPGRSWAHKIAATRSTLSTVGSWTRRMTDPLQVTKLGAAARELRAQGISVALVKFAGTGGFSQNISFQRNAVQMNFGGLGTLSPYSRQGNRAFATLPGAGNLSPYVNARARIAATFPGLGNMSTLGVKFP